MSKKIPPVPYKSPLTDNRGLLSQAWTRFFRDLFERVGGFEALSNTELGASALSLSTFLSGETATLSDVVDATNANTDDINDLNQGRQL